MRVRYPKTGTTGTVMNLEQIKGNLFAELDIQIFSTALTSSIPAEHVEKASKTIVEDVKTVIEREREFAAGKELQEAWKNIDQSL